MSEAARRWDVLGHRFYLRWSAGQLDRGELALYAGQYRHAVGALAQASEQAAALAPPAMAEELRAHAIEERAHVELWDAFADGVGAVSDAPALPETAACVGAWGDTDRSLLGTLVALHTIEAAQPAISDTKLAGLRDHYGVPDGPATEYFTVHAERDVVHAASARRLINEQLAGADHAALVAEAERVAKANWELLDGVQRATGTTA